MAAKLSCLSAAKGDERKKLWFEEVANIRENTVRRDLCFSHHENYRKIKKFCALLHFK